MDYENRSPAVEGVQKSWGRPVWEWSWSCKTDRGNRVWVLRVFLVFQGWKSVVGVWELRVAPPQWSRDWVGRGSRLLTSKDGQFVRHCFKKGSSHWLRIQYHVILFKYRWSTTSSDYGRPISHRNIFVIIFCLVWVWHCQRVWPEAKSWLVLCSYHSLLQNVPICPNPHPYPLPQPCLCLLYNLTSSKSAKCPCCKSCLLNHHRNALPSFAESKTCTI